MWISNFVTCVKPDILRNQLFFPKTFGILNKILQAFKCKLKPDEIKNMKLICRNLSGCFLNNRTHKLGHKGIDVKPDVKAVIKNV